MALLFVGGIMNFWWIAAITAYIAIEKLAPGGKQVSWIMGGALIVCGGCASGASVGSDLKGVPSLCKGTECRAYH